MCILKLYTICCIKNSYTATAGSLVRGDGDRSLLPNISDGLEDSHSICKSRRSQHSLSTMSVLLHQLSPCIQPIHQVSVSTRGNPDLPKSQQGPSATEAVC